MGEGFREQEQSILRNLTAQGEATLLQLAYSVLHTESSRYRGMLLIMRGFVRGNPYKRRMR
jgi:hypothetical protein